MAIVPTVTGAQITAWGDELRRVHQRLRQALQIARDSIEDGAAPDTITRDLQIFCWGFCTALDGHHTSEDRTLFPELLRRRPDLAPTIAKLKQDHSMLSYLIKGLEKATTEKAEPEVMLQHLDGIEAVMETHFRFEEKQLLGILDELDDLDLERHEVLGPIA